MTMREMTLIKIIYFLKIQLTKIKLIYLSQSTYLEKDTITPLV